jgi:hypothetical protein
MARGASAGGTSIPITKGGTGATTPNDAIKNLLPDFATNNGKVLGSTGTTIGWVDQNNPVIQSSNDTGKVKIDDTAKTMTVSGETAISGGVVYSINRPDKWPANTELDFGDRLLGQHFVGTYTMAAPGVAVRKVIWNVPTPNISQLIQYGGYIKDRDGRIITLTASETVSYGSAGLYRLASDELTLMITIFGSTSGSTAAYDVWATYKI